MCFEMFMICGDIKTLPAVKSLYCSVRKIVEFGTKKLFRVIIVLHDDCAFRKDH